MNTQVASVARVPEQNQGRSHTLSLTAAALGVVYGDIGTSPLYAFRECFRHELTPNTATVLGALSLIFWTLMGIVTVKYFLFVLRADNKGEGGILALSVLCLSKTHHKPRYERFLLSLGLLGAALLYGDGAITPTITVLSAVEGLEIATAIFKPYILPITIVILIGLFWIQHRGTGQVGRLFGPIMFLWFLTLGVLGLLSIIKSPSILAALSPHYAMQFFTLAGVPALAVMGSVFLVVTGAEALYADIGHFGLVPIRRAWFYIVFPALLLNYFGQGALVLAHPVTAANPFYYLAPTWAVAPLVVLATAAAVIASQALISGAFSITMQAMQLGYLPRTEIRHTSSLQRGQVYLPLTNWLLCFACIGLVFIFQDSSHLAAAYGVAVTLTMIITSFLFFEFARSRWQWPGWKAGLLTGAFLTVEIIFFTANALKISHGGWVPLLVAGLIYWIMVTWKRGRQFIYQKLSQSNLPLKLFLDDLRQHSPQRVRGTAVFMAGSPEGTPIALLHNLEHNDVLHERAILLTMVIDEAPRVNAQHRVSVEPLGQGFYRVIGRFGFMERVSVGEVFRACEAFDLRLNKLQCTFFLSRETILTSNRRGMAQWRKRLFAFLSRNAQPATTYFSLPPNRVVELGMQIEY